MTSSILATKLFIPPTRPELVPRPRLIEKLNKEIFQLIAPGLHQKAVFGANFLALSYNRYKQIFSRFDRITESFDQNERDKQDRRFGVFKSISKFGEAEIL